MKILNQIRISNCIIRSAITQRYNSATVMKLFYPAADRNKDPILGILQRHIQQGCELNFLEISSGSGQHVAHFAQNFPQVTFHPSEVDPKLLKSIAEYAKSFPNVQPPVQIDVSTDFRFWGDGTFKENTFDYVYNSNMMHITPYKCTVGLFKNAGALLKAKGILITYGPYGLDGFVTPESNVRFDASLRAENPDWGLRDIRDCENLGFENGIELLQIYDMPANNKTVIWRKI